MRGPSQAGQRNLRDETPLSSAQIPGQRPGTRAGRKYHQRSSADWLQANAPRHGPASDERCSRHVSPSWIQRHRRVSHESDAGYVVHGARVMTVAPASRRLLGGRPRPPCLNDYKLRGFIMKTLLALILCSALSSFAATSKSVSYKSGDETVQAMLYAPDGKGPFPGIIVIHEYWGLNDWVKEQASKLADQGYVALAIDLYRGKVATTPDEAHEIMRGVPEDRAKRDLHAVFEFLKSQPNVKKDRIASIGWCMGGGYSLQLALNEPKLAADVINYGVYDYASLAKDQAAIKKINAPIMGFFGAQDRGIPTDDLRKFWEQLKSLGKKADFS